MLGHRSRLSLCAHSSRAPRTAGVRCSMNCRPRPPEPWMVKYILFGFASKAALRLPVRRRAQLLCSKRAPAKPWLLREEERQQSALASRQPPACLKRSLTRRGNRCTRKPLSPEWLRLLDLKGQRAEKAPRFWAVFEQKSLKMRHFRGLQKFMRQRATSKICLT